MTRGRSVCCAFDGLLRCLSRPYFPSRAEIGLQIDTQPTPTLDYVSIPAGGFPYPSVANEHLLAYLQSGHRLAKPDGCNHTV